MPTYLIVLLSGMAGGILGFFLASCIAVKKHEEDSIHRVIGMKKE